MEYLKGICLKEKGTDPFEIAEKLMKVDGVPIHGPIHHFIDGAAVMTALRNAGWEFDLEAGLDELIVRACKMPGATCGQWGVCGSASSVGAALSIVTGTGPLSDTEHYKNDMHMTAKILNRIADIGGPRCCKRNAFIAIGTAVEEIYANYGIQLINKKMSCGFNSLNKQCIGDRCPFRG